MGKYGIGLNREIVQAVNRRELSEPITPNKVVHFVERKGWHCSKDYIRKSLKFGCNKSKNKNYRKYFFGSSNEEYFLDYSFKKLDEIKLNGKWFNLKKIQKCNGFKYENGIILTIDALRLLNSLNENIADIIFLDPPFNLGKDYGHDVDDKKDEVDYIEFIEKIIISSIKVLKSGGSLYLYHIPKYAIQFSNILNRELNFIHWIAVSMKNGFVRGNGLYPAHYALLLFTKGNPKSLKRPKIQPLTCPHCNNYIKDYGGYKEFVKDGVNLSDFWEDISPVRHKKYKNRTQNELPLKLTDRVMQISGLKNGLLVDPFAGAGTSLVSAKKSALSYIGSDIERANCHICNERITDN